MEQAHHLRHHPHIDTHLDIDVAVENDTSPYDSLRARTVLAVPLPPPPPLRFDDDDYYQDGIKKRIMAVSMSQSKFLNAVRKSIDYHASAPPVNNTSINVARSSPVSDQQRGDGYLPPKLPLSPNININNNNNNNAKRTANSSWRYYPRQSNPRPASLDDDAVNASKASLLKRKISGANYPSLWNRRASTGNIPGREGDANSNGRGRWRERDRDRDFLSSTLNFASESSLLRRTLTSTSVVASSYEPPKFSSDVAARAYLVRQRISSSKRSLYSTEGEFLRLITTKSGGDCGFEAIAWGLQISQGSGPSALELRNLVSKHVLAHKDNYVSAAGAGSKDVEKFARNVLKTGLAGHWLGAQWGALEIIAISRAIGYSLRLYTFDTKLQKFRPYFEEKIVHRNNHIDSSNHNMFIRLLFTGEADRGHFDCLVPEKKTLCPPLWRRRFVRKLANAAQAVG